MARPQKKSIDYFPLDCNPDDSVRFIEAKHGIIGFGILIKLWSKVYSSDGYFCYWNEKAKYLFCKENSISLNEIESILETCFSEQIFNQKLYEAHHILSSTGIQKRYFKIVKEAKRKDVDVNPNFYLLRVNSGINSINSGVNEVNTGVTQEESTQRKEKENKVNKRKVKGKENTPSKSSLESENSKGVNVEKEKSSAQKENDVVNNCKEVFLNRTNGYYWEQQDTTALIKVLDKINHSFGGNLTHEELQGSFDLFIVNLPKYWRTKKFTLPLLNRNFNEIITEIQTQNTDEKQTKSKFGRHSISDLAKRASTFGR